MFFAKHSISFEKCRRLTCTALKRLDSYEVWMYRSIGRLSHTYVHQNLAHPRDATTFENPFPRQVYLLQTTDIRQVKEWFRPLDGYSSTPPWSRSRRAISSFADNFKAVLPICRIQDQWKQLHDTENMRFARKVHTEEWRCIYGTYKQSQMYKNLHLTDSTVTLESFIAYYSVRLTDLHCFGS